MNGYTSHGHPIEGVLQVGPRPVNVARCGGEKMCVVCLREADEARGDVVTHPAMDRMERAKLLVAQYYNKKAEKTDDYMLGTDSVYIVWYVYLLGGWKMLLSTTANDGMYYELTYDKDGRQTFFDAYKKWENIAVPDGEWIHEF